MMLLQLSRLLLLLLLLLLLVHQLMMMMVDVMLVQGILGRMAAARGHGL
jgi:hypothetical protein